MKDAMNLFDYLDGGQSTKYCVYKDCTELSDVYLLRDRNAVSLCIFHATTLLSERYEEIRKR